MALTYIACFLVILQVVSANHITITESLPAETTSDFAMDFNDTTTDVSSPPEEADSTDDATVSEEVQTSTLSPLNATATTTDNSTDIVVTYLYVTVTDGPSTTVEPETTLKPKPIENMATVASQSGMMILLPILVRFLWPLWWSR